MKAESANETARDKAFLNSGPTAALLNQGRDSFPTGVCGNTLSKEKNNNTANSGVFFIDSLSNRHQGSFLSHTQDQERNIEELEMAWTQSLLPRPRLQDGGSPCPPSPSETDGSEIYFVELVKDDGTLGFSVTGDINTGVLYGGIYVKSIIPGGPAAKGGQILQERPGQGSWWLSSLPSLRLPGGSLGRVLPGGSFLQPQELCCPPGGRLLQVDGESPGGLTHKQAVQCLRARGR
ncbi:hypothetical protein MC885_008495 [Smutsia gigantea]|nr:hypothetical protein MC885_008495 [Smutsia gigantea]